MPVIFETAIAIYGDSSWKPQKKGYQISAGESAYVAGYENRNTTEPYLHILVPNADNYNCLVANLGIVPSMSPRDVNKRLLAILGGQIHLEHVSYIPGEQKIEIGVVVFQYKPTNPRP